MAPVDILGERIFGDRCFCPGEPEPEGDPRPPLPAAPPTDPHHPPPPLGGEPLCASPAALPGPLGPPWDDLPLSELADTAFLVRICASIGFACARFDSRWGGSRASR